MCEHNAEGKSVCACVLTFCASAPVTATMRRMPLAMASSETMTNGAAWPEFCRWLQITESNNTLPAALHNCGRQQRGRNREERNHYKTRTAGTRDSSKQHQRYCYLFTDVGDTLEQDFGSGPALWFKVDLNRLSGQMIQYRHNLSFPTLIFMTWNPAM